MKIAIPVSEGKATSFSHCKQFAIMNVDPLRRVVLDKVLETRPQCLLAVLPEWVSAQGANVLIAEDVGFEAQGYFASSGIEVLIGAPSEGAEELANLYLGSTISI